MNLTQETKEITQIIELLETAYPELGYFLKTFARTDNRLRAAILESWKQLLQIWEDDRYGMVGIKVKPKSVRVVSATAKLFDETENYLDKSDSFLLREES